MQTTTLARLFAGIAISGLALAGCGGTTAAPATSQGQQSAPAQAEIDNADVAFAQGMIVHHQQALDMAALAEGRSQNAQVLDLATRVQTVHRPEIDSMAVWLRDWGADVPAGGDASMGGMDHGGMDMSGSGAMDPERMQQLEQATGAAFDQMFLEMMIEHHRGALAMAQTEVADGSDPRAVQLAQTGIGVQQAQITEMEALLQQ